MTSPSSILCGSPSKRPGFGSWGGSTPPGALSRPEDGQVTHVKEFIMRKSQLTIANEYAKKHFDREGFIEFSLISVPSKTWGINMQLWAYNQKMFVASGCGYNKETACLEHGITTVLSGIEANPWDIIQGAPRISDRYKEKYSLYCNYSGKHESSYTFRRT